MLPEVFLERLERIVPAEVLPGVVASFSDPRRTGARANPLKGDPVQTLESLRQEGIACEPLPWFPLGFSVAPDNRQKLLDSAASTDKRIYVQNPSSMIPVLELDVRPEQRVLDLTAAPGSKTLQIAAQLGASGELAAVEVVRKRFFKLKKNLADFGASNVRVFLQDGRRVDRYRPVAFDRVLLDAPCSTEGRFRSDEPDTFRYWSVRKIREMAHKQRQLIEAAVRCTRPGGLVVYSTCSFAPEENESVVQHALEVFGSAISIEPPLIDLPRYSAALPSWEGATFDEAIRNARRILPDSLNEGFFVSRIRVGQG